MTNQDSENSIITIVGPTACGKSQVAMALATEFDAEIICADSRTIYKGMDIGTAKPSDRDREKVRHHLLDIVEPGQNYTVAQFVVDASAAITDIQARNKRVIIVGGSGMYVDALLYDYQFRNSTGVEQAYVETLSETELIELAQKLYPQASSNYVLQNRRRVEQLLMRGPANSADRITQKLCTTIVGIVLNKDDLQINIYNRTNSMLNNGFVQEVDKLVKKYGHLALFDETIGYKQVLGFLEGGVSESDLAPSINIATRQYAKRQLTWFKRNKAIIWVDSPDKAIQYLVQNLKN
jgi:tRNA dimethylallyltransferase